MEAKYDFLEIISSLPAAAKAMVSDLHETALALGYEPSIAPAGKKPDYWKCEYATAKPKRVLYLLRVTGPRFSIRAKLFHLSEYIDVLESCGVHCKTSLLSASKNCGNHRGGCAGPITFSVGGKSYVKCRHYFLWKDMNPEDLDGIRRLLQEEAKCSESQSE